jgi:hypothetical protein
VAKLLSVGLPAREERFEGLLHFHMAVSGPHAARYAKRNKFFMLASPI